MTIREAVFFLLGLNLALVGLSIALVILLGETRWFKPAIWPLAGAMYCIVSLVVLSDG